MNQFYCGRLLARPGPALLAFLWPQEFEFYINPVNPVIRTQAGMPEEGGMKPSC